MEVEEFQRGCSPTILSDRINDKDALAAKYDLDLVAGTFFRVPFSPTYGTGIVLGRFPKFRNCELRFLIGIDLFT